MHPDKSPVITAAVLFLFLSCCSSSNNKNTSNKQTPDKIKGPYVRDTIGPGSADIQATMQNYSEKETGYICTLKIQKVNGYGPSTPMLPVGYELKAEVPKLLLENNGYTAEQIFTTGKLLQMIINYQKQVISSDSSLNWTVTGFSNLSQ